MRPAHTSIVVRPRSYMELFDLALLVIAEHWLPLMLNVCVFVLPAVLLDVYLCQWILDDVLDSGFVTYLAILALLVFVQAPLVTAPLTIYLGRTMFMQHPALRDVAGELWQSLGALLLHHGLYRGAIVGTVMLFVANWVDDDLRDVILFWFVAMCLVVGLFRAFRPFMNEVLLLERGVGSRNRNGEIPLSRRLQNLHGSSANQVTVRSVLSLPFAVVITMSQLCCAWFLIGMVFGAQRLDGSLASFCVPLSLWGTANFFAIVRFLNYIDIRIRNEGWDLQLLTYAALRQTHELDP